jgi:hypothetical protein
MHNQQQLVKAAAMKMQACGHACGTRKLSTDLI